MAKETPRILFRSNEKLHFAQLYIELLQQNNSDLDSLRQKVLTKAHWETAVLHLMGAYVGLLQQIAHNYELPLSGILSLEQLEQQFVQRGYVSPELARIRQLLNEPNTWLSHLHQAYVSCWQLEQLSTKPVDANILASTVSQITPVRSPTELTIWLDQLTCLIKDIRQSMEEW